MSKETIIVIFLCGCNLIGGTLPPESSISGNDTDNPRSDIAFYEKDMSGKDFERNSDLSIKDTSSRSDIGDDINTSDFGDADDTTMDVFSPVALISKIDRVQPMSGIAIYERSWNGDSIHEPGNIQLESFFISLSDFVIGKKVYDWSIFESTLNRISSRKHQAIPRIVIAQGGEATGVPDYIKRDPSYQELSATIEGKITWFPDWRSQELQSAMLDFFTAFALRYDKDPRIAFLQVGFGLWGEYHIYEGPRKVGEQFPSFDFQTQFLNQLDQSFHELRWSISVLGSGRDSHLVSVFTTSQGPITLPFGLFDSEFMSETHHEEMELHWDYFDYPTRYENNPMGGEFYFGKVEDLSKILNKDTGAFGLSYKTVSAKFHISYIVGDQQPRYQSDERIREAGMENGYRFRITKFEASQNKSRIEVKNEGVAPIYYDAFPTIGGKRSQVSLKGLLPNQTRDFEIDEIGTLSIESDHILSGQIIQYNASLH